VAHPAYVDALIPATAQDTVYTEAFSVGWPEASHRVLRSAVEAAQAFPGDIVGEGVNRSTGERYPKARFAVGTVDKSMTGAIEAMALWAGESVGGVKLVQRAADIVRELAGGAEALLRRWT